MLLVSLLVLVWLVISVATATRGFSGGGVECYSDFSSLLFFVFAGVCFCLWYKIGLFIGKTFNFVPIFCTVSGFVVFLCVFYLWFFGFVMGDLTCKSNITQRVLQIISYHT